MNKVSVIGGGDLGMASLMSILTKVLYILYLNNYPIFDHSRMLSYSNTDSPPPPSFLPSVKWINLFSLTLLTAPLGAAVRIWESSVYPMLRCSEVCRLLNCHDVRAQMLSHHQCGIVLEVDAEC